MKNRISLPLLLVLSATAFSASVMTISDSHHHQIIQNIPPVAGCQISWKHWIGVRFVAVSIQNITSGWHILLTPVWFFTMLYYPLPAPEIIGGRSPKLTPGQWAQARCLMGSGAPRRQVAIIYDVGLLTVYRKFPANKSGGSKCCRR